MIFLLSLQTQAVDEYTKSLIELDTLLTDIESQEKTIEDSLLKIRQNTETQEQMFLRQDILYQKEDLNQMRIKYRRLRNLFMYKYPQRARRDLRKREDSQKSVDRDQSVNQLDSLQQRLSEVKSKVLSHWGEVIGRKSEERRIKSSKTKKKPKEPSLMSEGEEKLLLVK